MIWSATTRGSHAHLFVPGRGRSLCGGYDKAAITNRQQTAKCPQCMRLEKEREERGKGAA